MVLGSSPVAVSIYIIFLFQTYELSEGKNNVNLSNWQYLENLKFWAFGLYQSSQHLIQFLHTLEHFVFKIFGCLYLWFVLIIVLDYCFLVLTHFTSKFSPLCRLLFALFFLFYSCCCCFGCGFLSVFFLFFVFFFFCHFDWILIARIILYGKQAQKYL